mgnify:CR=1 FL=1
MEFYGVLKINDPQSGELLEKVDGFFTTDEEINASDYLNLHEDDFKKALEDKLEYDYNGSGAIARMDVVLLADEEDEEDEDGE